jgi:hypothetical protein
MTDISEDTKAQAVVNITDTAGIKTMTDFSEDTYPTASEERERMAVMLENWFQQRTKMTSRAFRLILLPLIAVVLFATAFWFSYYIPVHWIVPASLFAVSMLLWVICLFVGGRVIRRVRIGDTLMLRKIRSATPGKT